MVVFLFLVVLNLLKWLSVSGVLMMNDDLFAFRIHYEGLSSEAQGLGEPLYNGNISQTLWRTAKDNIQRGYVYGYDKLNRLLEADFYKEGTNPYTGAYAERMAYDLNGNIVSLVRTTGDAGSVSKLVMALE